MALDATNVMVNAWRRENGRVGVRNHVLILVEARFKLHHRLNVFTPLITWHTNGAYIGNCGVLEQYIVGLLRINIHTP